MSRKAREAPGRNRAGRHVPAAPLHGLKHRCETIVDAGKAEDMNDHVQQDQGQTPGPVDAPWRLIQRSHLVALFWPAPAFPRTVTSERWRQSLNSSTHSRKVPAKIAIPRQTGDLDLLAHGRSFHLPRRYARLSMAA